MPIDGECGYSGMGGGINPNDIFSMFFSGGGGGGGMSGFGGGFDDMGGGGHPFGNMGGGRTYTRVYKM